MTGKYCAIPNLLYKMNKIIQSKKYLEFFCKKMQCKKEGQRVVGGLGGRESDGEEKEQEKEEKEEKETCLRFSNKLRNAMKDKYCVIPNLISKTNKIIQIKKFLECFCKKMQRKRDRQRVIGGLGEEKLMEKKKKKKQKKRCV